MEKLKWGILGTGFIANFFAECMSLVPEAEKTAVSGTSLAKANDFADKHGFAGRFEDFDEMLEKSDLDIAYIAVPNNLHFEYVSKALDAGLHVLCEKPIFDNELQLTAMIDKAREKNLFLMEALWTRCFPATLKARQWMDEGRIGQLRSVRADFGIKATPGWQGWKASAEYSGGALRDVGIYALGMAFLGFQRQAPKEVISSYFLKSGADYHSELLLKYEDNCTAFLTGSFNMVTDHRAVFYGDKGTIILGPQLWHPSYAELILYDPSDEFTRNSAEVFEDNYESNGMQYEIAHVNECILAGARESSYFPLSESLELMRLTDSLRKEWGVRYASDTW